MSEPLVPAWLEAELRLNHAGIEIRWMPYGHTKTFVLPITGDAFYRMPVKRLFGVVLHRRYIHANSSMKWKLHPLTYMPTDECAPEGRFVVFQHNHATGETVKVFDVVNDDGSLHPLDRRVIDAINLRDGKHGAHEKALKDVEAAPARADALAFADLEERTADLFERIHYDVSKHASGGACITPDPTEDDLSIMHGKAGEPLDTVYHN